MLILLLGFFVPLITLSEQQSIWNLPPNFNRENANSYVNDILRNQTPPGDITDCKRTCVTGQSRVCYHMFHGEHYQAMGAACGNCSQGVLADCYLPQCVAADGIEKGILTLNRMLPGPLIETCQGDLVVIDVMNELHSDTFSIHWHGLLQKRTQYMDGVPHVTQCPITPMARFRYTFWSDDIGTYFYHSHSGMQKYLGIYGGFITRAPAGAENYPPNLYTVDDRVIILNDYSHEAGEMFMVGLPTRQPGSVPQVILINGRGKTRNPTTNGLTNSPYEVIPVTSGNSYRIRIINAVSMVCPIELQIQNHRMRVIGVDGSPVRPVFVDTLVLTSGERVDVVVQANQPVNLYWIYTRLTGICTQRNITQVAVLSYRPGVRESGQIPTTPITPYPRGVVLNDPAVACRTSPNYLCISDLQNNNGRRYAGIGGNPAQRHYLTFGNRPIENTEEFFAQREYTPFWNIRDSELYLGTVNGISFQALPYPLLTQPSLNGIEFCNYDNMPERCINQSICRCLHALSLPRNRVIDFVFIDEAPEYELVVHPIHLHGVKFAVLGEGQIPTNGSLTVERMRAVDRQMRLRNINNENPVLKDTIMVRSQGYALVRIYTDNPGIWLAHCHVDDHMLFGMVFAFVVEGPVPPIPDNFPTCGDFP